MLPELQRSTTAVLSMLFPILAIGFAASAGLAGQPPDFEKQLEAILPDLAASDAGARARADRALEKMCLAAARPGAESERKAASRALAARLGPEVSLEARERLVRQLRFIGRDESVPALSSLLKEDQPPALREAARRALEADPAPQAVRALRQAHAASAGELRAAFIQSLGARRDSLSVGALLDDAHSENGPVRFAALEALAEIGDRSAVDVFEEALQKSGPEDARIRKAYLRLAETLGEGEEGGAGRRIYLQALQWGPEARLAGLEGLGRLGIIADARILFEALGDPDQAVRDAARQSLITLRGGAKPIIERIDKASPAMRREIAGILGRREEPAAEAALAKLAGDADAGTRAAAEEALKVFRDSKARPRAAPEEGSAAPVDRRVGVQLYIWSQHFGARKENVEDHLDEVFESCRKAGFGAVQGWLSSFSNPDEAERVGGLLARHHLAMPAAYTGGAMHTETGARAAIEEILRQARLGKQHGLEIVVMNPDTVGREKTDEELAVQARSLNSLGEALEGLGLRLAIHTHDPEMRSGAREWYHILRNTDPKKVGFCLDLHWVFRGKQDPIRLLEDAGQRTLDLHLRNSTGGIWSEDFGDGDIDYRKVRKALDGLGYRGLYTLELAYEGGTKVTRSLEEDLRRSRRYVRMVLGQ
jgi:inosose dehydratase